MKDKEIRNRLSAVRTSPSSSGEVEGSLHGKRPLNPRSSALPKTDRAVASVVHPPTIPQETEEPPQTTPVWLPAWLLRLAGSWQFWGVLVLLIAGTTGFAATTALFKLPSLPSCPSLFLPLASASVRLYCAQISADKQTIPGLLYAIELLEALPADHPMREEIDRNIEQWSVQILDLADEKFQEGEIEEAISVARKIPKYVKAHELVDERIAKWESVWEKAEDIAAQAEQLMLDSKWGLAFRMAAKLTGLGNRYWGTTRYEQLVEKIRLAQEESGKLDKAYKFLKWGGVDNLVKAIELAEQIKPESTAYREAQKLATQAGDKLLDLAMAELEAGDWSEVLSILNRLPSKLSKQEEIADLNNLAEAGSQAGSGTAAGLQAAIDAAKAVPPGRPLYDKAQRFIGRWQLEIQDLNTLAKAEELADGGGVNYLTAAIAQARLVPRSNPRYREAQNKISEWTRQIQVLEDQPVLERAEQYASAGDNSNLQRAIAEVGTIDPNRALYREAQQRAQQWQENLERSEDEPYLDRARSLTSGGDIPGAIDTAEQISRGRASDPEAQSDIGRWRGEIQGRLNLERAYQTARTGTPNALSSAIRTAKEVPSNSPLYNQSVQASNSWSDRILTMARERADYNVGEAIAIAEMVPEGTSAYQPARVQIEVWQQRLEPRLPERSPSLNNDSPPPSAPADNEIIIN